MFEEFKKFIMRGNVVDMAVGVVMGAAFGAIINSLVNDIIMPPINVVLKSLGIQDLMFVLKDGTPVGPYATLALAKEAGAVTWNVGAFFTAILSFLIVAASVFMLVKAVNRMYAVKAAPPVAPAEPTTKVCTFCQTEIPIKATRCPHCTSQL